MHVSRSNRATRFVACLLTLSGLGVAHSALAANSAPVIKGTPLNAVAVNSAYSFTPTASDANGDRLYFSVTNRPSWAGFDPNTGKIWGTPWTATTWKNIYISVSDGKTSASIGPFSITASANVAPKISGTPATTVAVGGSYSFKPTTSDSNGDTLAFSIANKPSWATFSTTSGQLTGKPTSSNVGTYSSISVSVSDGKLSTKLPSFSIAVTGPANAAPVISGSPANSINAGTAYSFKPTATDANGDALTFKVSNLPGWATFSTSTGQISGTPTGSNVGTYSNIVIAVSDGKVTSSLPAFSIAVTQVSAGSATLSWTPPTENTDGSQLTDLAGYRLHYGTSAGSMNNTVSIDNPGLTAYVLSDLSPGTWYFALKALSKAGAESDFSNVTTVTVK